MCTLGNSALRQASRFLQNRSLLTRIKKSYGDFSEEEEEFYLMKTFTEENIWFTATWVLWLQTRICKSTFQVLWITVFIPQYKTNKQKPTEKLPLPNMPLCPEVWVHLCWDWIRSNIQPPLRPPENVRILEKCNPSSSTSQVSVWFPFKGSRSVTNCIPPQPDHAQRESVLARVP